MGICLVTYPLADSNIDAVLADPPLVWRVVSPDDEAPYLAAHAAAQKKPLLERLLGRAKPAQAPRRLLRTSAEMREADLDKAWDGLNHCLKPLTGGVPDFFDGAAPLGPLDLGLGPAQYHRSAAMAQIAAAYARISERELLNAFDQIDFDGVYLDEVWMRGDTETTAYLLEHFAGLKAFAAHCAQHSLGAVLRFT